MKRLQACIDNELMVSKVMGVLDGRYGNIEDEETRTRTLRMYMKEKANAYVVDLRKNAFEVVVYDDELTLRFQQEAEMIAELSKKAMEEGAVTEQRQQELQKWFGTPPPE